MVATASYQLSHVCRWRFNTSSDSIVVEKELINITVVEFQTNRFDQWWHEEAQANTND